MKLLVVGCGSIGMRHARNAVELGEVAVVDTNREALERCAAETGAHPFPDLDRALAWKPDGVIVATPHITHFQVASRAIDAGVEVLVEKPITPEPVAARSLIDRAAAAGRRVFVVCNMRYHPALATLRAHLPRIGRPLFARAHYGEHLPDMRPGVDYRDLYCSRRDQGGGVILDCVHELDYLTWLLGPAKLVASEAGTLSDLEIDVEDYAAIILRHASGTRSEIHLDYLQRVKRRGCEIAGTVGTLVWQSTGKRPEACLVRLYSAEARRWETLLDEADLDISAPYRSLMERFTAALAGAETDLQTGEEALTVLDLALAARAPLDAESREMRRA